MSEIESQPTADEPKKLCFLIDQFTGHLSLWAVRQSPYDGGPANLVEVLTEFAESIRRDMHPLMGTHYIELVTRDEVEAFYQKHLYPLLGFRQWNLSKAEMDAGVLDPEDPERTVKFTFVSRHGGPPADHDIIDLDALIDNVVASCYAESVQSRREHDEEAGR